MESGYIKTVKIVYYSGTGNTKKVADCFEETFKNMGVSVLKYSVTDPGIPFDKSEDLLVVVYAVHAMNAPEPIYCYIDHLSQYEGGRAVVISVSGGGEVMPNTACRVSAKRRLRKRGIDVCYERMIVMPSNWIVETKEALAVRLLEVLPERVDKIVGDLLSGVRRMMRPNPIDRLLSRRGELEKLGTKYFGSSIKCSGSCSGCRWCSSHCPSGNIRMIDDKPVFGGQCHMCLNCIYGCPKQALSAGALKFVIIKNGFHLKELEQKIPYPEPVDVKEQAKGFVWSGVRKYLLKDGQ